MIGPLVLVAALAVAGGLTAGGAGAVAGAALGVLVTVAVTVAAAIWARGPGSLIHPNEVREHAPRPPGFGRLCDWVYDRTLG